MAEGNKVRCISDIQLVHLGEPLQSYKRKKQQQA